MSRRAWLGLWIAAAALIVPVAHLALGRGVDWSELLAGTDTVSWRVLTELRLPRLVVALFAGTALGLAGLALQSVLRNPLAAPELTAVNPSAVLGYLIASGTGLIDGGSVFSSVLSATVGGLLGGGLLWLVAHRRTSEQTAVLGLLSALALTGVVTILIAARPTGVGGALRWLIGSVEARVAEHVPMIAIPVLAGFAALVLVADRLEILAVSDSHAHCLGISPGFWRGVGIGIAVLLASAAVATVGPLAFVGFVSPHVVRLVFGGRLRRQVVLVAVCGGLFVAASDLIAKAVSLAIQLTGDGQQVGVPVGAVTCLIGAAALVAVASSHQESEP